MNSKKRVLVVGAKFGEVYLNSFFNEQPGFELCGLMAKGSPRAYQLAKAFGIPLYTSLGQLPDAFDVACVVVRSTVVGGSGTYLAESLLRRGMHVVQEHPVHPTDIETLQTFASSLGLVYWVNSLYSNTLAGRRWIYTARAIRAELDGMPASFAHLITSRQLLYSSLDLLLQGLVAERIDVEVRSAGTKGVFDEIHISTTGPHVSVNLQNYIDAADHDQHSLVMHHCQLGWPSGYLTLAASFGPVIWVPTFFDKDHLSEAHSMYNRTLQVEGARFLCPTAATLYPAPADWRTVFERSAPEAISYVFRLLSLHLKGKETSLGFQSSHQLAVARLWQQVLRCVGSPQQRDLKPPIFIDPQRIVDRSLTGVSS